MYRSLPETATPVGDHGLSLIEPAPFGVIGAITPCTNPTSTIICNAIGMVAAGNVCFAGAGLYRHFIPSAVDAQSVRTVMAAMALRLLNASPRGGNLSRPAAFAKPCLAA